MRYFRLENKMDFKCVKRTFMEASGGFVTKNNSPLHKKTTLWPKDLNFVKQEPRRYDILSSLASCFPHGNLRNNIEIYISSATGLYNLCDDAKWKCISRCDDSLYHHLVQQRYKEDCLTTLGIGKDVSDIPYWVQQLVMNQIRPKTSNVGVQATPDKQDFGVQAKPVETSEIDVQASADMTDFGVQAKPIETSEIDVQVSAEMTDFGVQAKPVTTSEIDVQACADTMDFGVQAKPVATSEIDVQASTDTMDFGVQACCTQTINIQTQTTNETTEEVVMPKTVILQVNMTPEGKVNSIRDGGMDVDLNEDEGNIILEVLKKSLARKAKQSMAAATGTASVAPAPAPDPVPTQHPAPVLIPHPAPVMSPKPARIPYPAPVPTLHLAPISTPQSRPSGFGLSPFGHNKVETKKTSIVCEENQQKVTTGTVTSRYGYNAPDDMPSTMVDVQIPIVPSSEIILKKRENSKQFHILGNGSYGFVYMAKHLKNPLASICVKDFDPDNSSTFDIYQETQTLLYLQSTHFVPKCYGLMESPITPIAGAFALVQECYAGGCTLKNLIDNPPATFGKWSWVCIIYQLFYGLDAIHSKHILINDIKTDNVLIDVHGDELSNLRYIDLGLASFRCGFRFKADHQYMAQFLHLAPEVRRGFFTTPASDVYSIGVIVNEIYSTFQIKELESIVDGTMKDNPGRRDKCERILQKLEGLLYL